VISGKTSLAGSARVNSTTFVAPIPDLNVPVAALKEWDHQGKEVMKHGNGS
jgi:hypothetical protein